MNAHCRIEFSDDRWGPTAFSASKDADFDHGWKTAKSALQLGRLKPGRTYSKRSSRLAQLRNDAAALSKLDLEEVTPPSIMSMHAARTFINGLCEGCLDFDLEISHDGEINFLYGDETELFHVHIDEHGALSYYAKWDGGEMFGDDKCAGEFPHQELLRFVDHRK